MGNFTGRQSEKQEIETKSTIARKKINCAREKYLKQIFGGEDICQENLGDEIDGISNAEDGKKLENKPSKSTDFDIKNYVYPFENLVFEGGGSKGLAYCGAVKVLEDTGLFSQIKRFAGTSAGAMTAALLAVGYNSEEIEEAQNLDLSQLLLDASYGYLSLLPNLLSGYGWNPGNRIYEWFGEALAKKSGGNPDITFSQLYELNGKELCIVVTNVNHMREEYCHVKTTPDMKIRLAVRMSMSIPVLFQATNYTQFGETNTYVDGGVLCNYSIHCFDGWWLSLKKEDSFMKKLQPMDQIPRLLSRKNRFEKGVNKTLGIVLYADSESDLFRYSLEDRIKTDKAKFPDTKLARKRLQKKRVQEKASQEHRRVASAVDAFLRVLTKNDLDRDDKINKTELQKAFEDEEFTDEHSKLLFGENCTLETAFDALDKDGNDVIQFHELLNFIQSIGICLQERFLGYQRQDITGLYSFIDTLQNALLINVKRVFVEQYDIDRTVGINTGHVGTTDFELEPEDRKYVIDQGRRSMESFLKYYAENNLNKKPASDI